MVALLRRNLGNIAPTGAVTINWGHPLAQGLVDCASMFDGQPTSLIYGSGRVAAAPKRSTMGMVVAAESDTVTWALPTITYSNITIAAVISNLTSARNYDAPVFSRGADSVGGLSRSAAGLNAGYSWNDQVATYGWSSGLTFPSGGPMMWAVSIEPTRARVQLNRTTAVNTTTHAAVGWGSNAYIGRDSYDVRAQKGAYHLAAVWRRSLSADEMAWLGVEPYAFLTQGPAAKSYFFLRGATSTFRPQIIISG